MTLATNTLEMHPDRLFSSDQNVVRIAREIYEGIKDLPIVSPHGHTDPSWFSDNKNFENATDLLIKPDHYVFRMLYSQGISLESLYYRVPISRLSCNCLTAVVSRGIRRLS